jgi:Protein of unknown function (DUF2891)
VEIKWRIVPVESGRSQLMSVAKDGTMRILCTMIGLCLVSAASLFAQPGDSAKIHDYVKNLPPTPTPPYGEVQRLALAANPLGCEEHPHAPGMNRPGYLWQRDGKPQILEDYDHRRAFYGCLDWHSAVNSTWMMVSLIKADPTIAVAPAIRNELASHFQKPNIDGELEFFTKLKGQGADFEKPYGYAWLLKLYGELKTWNDPDGQRAATVLEPLAKWMSDQYVLYLHSLNYPVRVGLHPNTALDMGFVLDYTSQVQDKALETAVHETAMRLFGNDTHCATSSEPVFGDFASPCLMEAALMGRVLTPENYAKWLDTFLPSVYSEEFQLYAKDIDAVHGDNRDTTGTDEEGLPNAHLIGLNFQRAADFMTIAQSLPKDDPRVVAYERLATINGKQGYDKIGAAGYLGTHWLATYALLYENLVQKQPQTTSNRTQAAMGKP